MSEVSCVEPKGPIDVEEGESGGGNSGLLGFVVLVGEQKGVKRGYIQNFSCAGVFL